MQQRHQDGIGIAIRPILEEVGSWANIIGFDRGTSTKVVIIAYWPFVVILSCSLRICSSLHHERRQPRGILTREFFRGWRSKLGCITLAMACVLACGWVRSLTTYDNVNVNCREWRYAFSSIDGRIWLYRTSAVEEGKSINWSAGSVALRTTDKGGRRQRFDPTTRADYKATQRWEFAGLVTSFGEFIGPTQQSVAQTSCFRTRRSSFL
jgi:hypothetical protein